MLKKRKYLFIEVSVSKSTKASPIKFFTCLSEKIDELHIEAMNSFISNSPNRLDEKCRWNGFPTSVAADQESFTVEYSYSDEYDEEGVPLNEKWKEITIFFHDELTDWIYIQFLNTIGLLKEKFEKKTDKQIQDSLSDLLPALELSGKKIDSSKIPIEAKKLYARGVNGVARYIHKHYKALMPKSKNDWIYKILQERNINDEAFEVKKLKESLSDAIIDYQEDGGFLLSGEDVKKSLDNFINKKFSKCHHIFIQKNIPLASYLISRIANHLDMSMKEIEIKNIFFFKAKPFKAGNCSKSISVFSRKNPDAIKAIDNMILGHLEKR